MGRARFQTSEADIIQRVLLIQSDPERWAADAKAFLAAKTAAEKAQADAVAATNTATERLATMKLADEELTKRAAEVTEDQLRLDRWETDLKLREDAVAKRGEYVEALRAKVLERMSQFGADVVRNMQLAVDEQLKRELVTFDGVFAEFRE